MEWRSGAVPLDQYALGFVLHLRRSSLPLLRQSLVCAVSATIGMVALGASATSAEPASPGATLAATGKRVLTEDRKILGVVIGLVLVALLLTLLTIRYWLHTRPVRPEPLVEAAPRRAREDVGRGSRRAVAGADHAGADDDWEPLGTGEHDRVEIPQASKVARPGRAGRQAVFDRDRA